MGGRVHSHDYEEETMKMFIREWYVTIIPIMIMVALSGVVAYLLLRRDEVLGL